jgi:hypothetical protein
MVNPLEAAFPALRPENYRITSPPTNRYNCIAWAAGDTGKWWWPVGHSRFFWPHGVPREETVTAFEAAFATLGYAPCDDAEAESGFERIALFCDTAGIPTHAARQLSNGRWTSKLGELDDIEHDLRHLEGEVYGLVVRLMKRAVTSS